jgi:mono/diheme cytochrome c family protein
MESFDSAVSLQCANCHGTDAGGGSAPSVYTDDNGTPDDPDDDVSQRVEWSAPPLNTVLLRFDEEEVRQIITYGRPGTPMQGFGVEGGGPKNTQSIDDLIAYLGSIQLSEAEAREQAMTALVGDEGESGNADDDVVGARDQAARQIENAEAALEAAESALAELEGDPEASDAELDRARDAVNDAEADLDWAQEWAARRVGVTDGQYLYELYCARCHTLSWSIFDPTVRSLDGVLGPAGGGGSLGFNLRDGQMQRRFPDEADHIAFITDGSEANAPYGNGGIGSGRMPGFGGMLTDEMIRAIVGYERDCLEATDPSQPSDEQLSREDVPECDPPDVPEADQ